MVFASDVSQTKTNENDGERNVDNEIYIENRLECVHMHVNFWFNLFIKLSSCFQKPTKNIENYNNNKK